MLVIFSFGLVLLATILLVVGLLNDSLGLIYLSIASSVAAAVVLFVAFRAARPKPHAKGERPEMLPDSPVDEVGLPAPEERQPVGAVAGTAAAPAAAPDETATIPAVAAADDDWLDDEEWDDEEVIDFPIADYDDLTVAEIMPLLPQLYSDELDVVIDRERSGRNRSTIINRLEELKVSGTEADAAEAEVAESGNFAAPAREPAPAAIAGDAAEDEDDLFPIADYDNLSVRRIVPLLPQLEEDELADVRAHEAAGAGRKTVLAEIDRLMSGTEAAPEPAPAPSRTRAAARTRTTASRTARSKATSRRERFPIANYDELGVRDIRPRLSSLSDRQLEQVLERERSGAGRKSIIDEIERQMSDTGSTAASTPRKASAPPRRAAKKAPSAARFPIANYDELGVREIRPRISRLSQAQLEQVLERERAGAARRSIIDEIEKRLP